MLNGEAIYCRPKLKKLRVLLLSSLLSCDCDEVEFTKHVRNETCPPGKRENQTKSKFSRKIRKTGICVYCTVESIIWLLSMFKTLYLVWDIFVHCVTTLRQHLHLELSCRIHVRVFSVHLRVFSVDVSVFSVHVSVFSYTSEF